MNPNLISLAERTVVVGAHLWVQSTLVIVAGLLTARLCRRHGPALESVILRTTLVAVVVCPIFSLLLGWIGLTGRSLELPGVSAPTTETIPVGSIPATVSAPVTVALPPAAATMAAVAKPAEEVTQGTPLDVNAAAPVRPSVGRAPADQVTTPIPDRALVYMVAAATWLLGGWYLLIRLVVSYRTIARMLRESDLAGVPIFESCGALAREMAVEPPEVRVHAEIKSPLLTGLVRPAILLPQLEGMEDLVATREVLVHELAHRVRGDCGWHLLSRAVTALLWFQPLLWLLARRIEETAEDVCDNYVIEHAGDRRGYAQQLVALAEQLQFSPAESLAGTGVIAFRSALGQRVVRILDASRNLSRRVDFRAWIAPTTALLAVTAAIGLVGVKAAEVAKLPSGGMTLKILASGTDWEPYGVLSPDEAKVAYMDWGSADDANIMIKDLATGKTESLTKADPADKNYDFADEVGTWSPDSTAIAYGWYSGKNSAYDVRITSLVDGKTRVLVPPGSDIFYSVEDWSSDGKNLLCSAFKPDHTQSLAILPVDSGGVRQLISLDWNRASHARFSPDGRFVVFARTINDNEDVYLLEIGGSQLRRLTDAPKNDCSPAWSADGKTILYSSNQRGTWDLWGISFADGKPAGAPFMVRPNFGNHSKRATRAGNLAFSASYGESDGYYVEVLPNRPEHVGPPRTISRSIQGENLSPTWSADGTKVAFIRDRRNIAIQSLVTGAEEVFNPGGMWWMSNILWSPDAKWMAVYPRGPKGNGLHLFNLETRELRAFTVAQKADLVGWSPDSSEFLFVDYRRMKPNFQAVRIADNSTRDVRLAEAPDFTGYFDLSPDKTRVVYAAARENDKEVDVIVADRALRNKKIIATFPRQPRFGTTPGGWNALPRWSPNGQFIAFYDRGLIVAAADGSWTAKVAPDGMRSSYLQKPPEWSKDGTKVAMTWEGKPRGEIGVLANFLANQAVAKAAAAPAVPARGAAMTQIVATGSDDAAYGTLSPDETMIAYVADEADDDGNLMVKTLSDGKSRKVTTSGYRIMPDVYEFVDSEIVWSPDSTSVAYKWVAGTPADSSGETRLTSPTRGELRISSVADGKMRVLIPKNPEIEYEPLDWSADGRTLLCGMERRDFSTALALVSVESGEMRQLLSLEWNRVNHARLSPDGRFIAFDRTVDGNQDIYVLEVGGNRLIRITDSPGSETGPVWSADGRTLLYSSDQRGMWDLWGTRMADGKPMGTPFVIRPAFGNPKKRLTRTGNLAFETSIGALDGYAIDVNLDGPKHLGAPKPIARSFLGRNASPTWSPDGSRVAQIRDWNLLAIQNVATGAEEVVNPGMRYMNNIYWSPDPKWIALYPAGPRLNGVHAFNVETHELRPIWDLNERPEEKNYRPMGWTADGKEFLALAERGSDLIAIRIADGQRRHVTIGEGKAVGYFAPSPDGRSVAFMSQEGQPALLVADREMKEIRPLAKLGAAPNLAPNRAVDPRVRNGIGARPSWSPDGRAIAHFVGKELHVTAADGGWDEKVDNGKLGPSPYTWKSPAWSSDGRKVAITLRGEGRAEIGLLKNFLPTEMVAAK